MTQPKGVYAVRNYDLGAVFQEASKYLGNSDLVLFYGGRENPLCVAVPRVNVLEDETTPSEVRTVLSVPAVDFEGPLKGCPSVFWVVKMIPGGAEVGVASPIQGRA